MIVTFYSFKGGLGRSMALANIAEILYRKGLRVLMVDWDLEAPGIEEFFQKVVQDNLQEHQGLIDLLLDYKAWGEMPSSDHVDLPPSIMDYAQDIYPAGSNDGYLKLVSAGKRDAGHFAAYAQKLRDFDWKDFFDNWEGNHYVEWLRKQMEEAADVTLIDSRTGVSEIGNVCLYHLADLLIAFTSGSRQSLEGTSSVLETLSTPRVQRLRAGRDLQTLVVPARVEDKAELASYNAFRQDFSRRFDRYCPSKWHREPDHSFWNLKIPYVPLYAFEEMVSVRERGTERESDLLEQAFSRLVEAIEDVLLIQNTGPRRVLVVEDDERWRGILGDIFSPTKGFEVELASTVQDTISHLEVKNYGLITLNLNLSQDAEQPLDGLKVLRWMSSEGILTPVLIITGSPVSMGQFRRWPVVKDIISKGSDIASQQSMNRIREAIAGSIPFVFGSSPISENEN